MKNSIAKKVTLRVSAVLVAALAVLFTASFLLVYRTIYTKARSNARSILTTYTEMITEKASKDNLIIDESFSGIALECGDKLCKWFDVDFVYLFVPDIETGKIRYLCVSQNDRYYDINPDDKYIGKVTEYTLTDEEKEVWNGQRDCSYSVTVSKPGHEISTMMRIEDSHGNRVMAGVDLSYENTNGEIARIFSMLAIVIILVILTVYFSVYYVINRLVSKPAKILSKNMNEFITDGKCSSIRLDERGSDEYSMMASAFNSMVHDIGAYMNDIGKLTREQERQKTELDIAAQIQKGFLPVEYLNSEAYEVRTTMIPARDVGGDFYYYMPLDDDRVFIVIADVSGKGISAALLMAVTMVLTVQFAQMKLSPAEILENVNDSISRNNAAMLFATEFLGIYDSRTQEFTYSNAGHNIPYIVVKDGIKALDGAGGTLLGLFGGEKYTQETVHLDVGDTIFLYTDGVTEATDSNKKFFGTERFEDTLGKFKESHSYNPISFVNEKLAEFSNGSEQHDDITMLTLNIKKTMKLSLDFDIKEFSKIKELILSLPISRPEQLKLCLCAEEWFVNICSYAFPDGVPENEKADFSLILSDRITMRFEDGGQPFNPLEHIVDIDSYDIETQVGGLGNFITVSNTDDIFYEYKDGKNILTMIRFYK